MAYLSGSATHVSTLETVFGPILAKWRLALQKRRVFVQTYRELSALRDVELSDIGIARVSIGRIAREAAEESVKG